MSKKNRFIYLFPIAIYIFVRIIILKIENNLSISYFLNYELSGVSRICYWLYIILLFLNKKEIKQK